MNTRLQVEHCVTEMVTVARPRGRAAPGRGGRAAVVHPGRRSSAAATRSSAASTPRTRRRASSRRRARSPGCACPAGPGVRWDGGYEEGDTISQYYDNLDRQARRVGARPRRGAPRGCSGRCGSSRSAASARPCPPHVAAARPPRLRRRQPLDEVGRGRGRPVAASRRRRRTGPGLAGADAEAEAASSSSAPCPVEVDGKRFSVRLWLPDARRRRAAGGRGGAAASASRELAAGGGGAGDGTSARRCRARS